MAIIYGLTVLVGMLLYLVISTWLAKRREADDVLHRLAGHIRYHGQWIDPLRVRELRVDDDLQNWSWM